MTKQATQAVAADGHVARPMDPWTQEKLHYIERYLHIFCTAMKDKWTLTYGDLLAGPGLCVDPETRLEVPGSPVLAVKRPEFDKLYLNDANPEAAAALTARTSHEPVGRVCVTALDCNQAVDTARAVLFPPNKAERTLGLAVIDPTAFQMRFDSLAKLTHGVRLDLIVIFMSGFIRRFIDTEAYEKPLDAFFGTGDWRTLRDKRGAGDQLAFRDQLDLYERQLRSIGYEHVNDTQRINNTKGAGIYHIIFASKHPRGAEFFGKISQQSSSGQRRLFS